MSEDKEKAAAEKAAAEKAAAEKAAAEKAAAEKAAAEKAAAEKNLIPMTKDGETIKVCKAQVIHHEAMGWEKAKK